MPKPAKVISQYTLSANATEGGRVSHNPNQITYEKGTQVTVTATPNDGYVFNGWTGAPSGVNASSTSITFAINSNLELTANFRKAIKRSDTLSFNVNDRYIFNKGFPATIEVYAIGGGGGGAGSTNSTSIGKGGNAGTIENGSIAYFGGNEAGVGGDGGYKHDKGSKGGDGKVVIVVTYDE